MIEKFAEEELRIIAKELMEKGMLPEKQDKRFHGRNAIRKLDTAIRTRYGGKYYSHSEQIHNAFYLLVDYISGNVDVEVRDYTYGDYADVKRHRQVEINPIDYQNAANALADALASMIEKGTDDE